MSGDDDRVDERCDSGSAWGRPRKRWVRIPRGRRDEWCQTYRKSDAGTRREV